MVIFGLFVIKGKSSTTDKWGSTSYKVKTQDEFGNKLVLSVTEAEYENYEVDGFASVDIRSFLSQTTLDAPRQRKVEETVNHAEAHLPEPKTEADEE